MASRARATLEALLRARRLDAGLVPVSPSTEAPAHLLASTGQAALDARLGGGWPRGQVSEVVGCRTSGRTRLALTSMAAATRRGELAALVDTLDVFDPDSTQPLDPDWSLWLWVRGRGLGVTRHRPGAMRVGDDHDLLAQAVDRALKATAMVLAAGGFGMVVLDLADVPAALLRRQPFTTWIRLQRLVEGREAVCLVVAPDPLTRSAGGVSVRLTVAAGEGHGWLGSSDWSRRFMAPGTRVTLARSRFVPDDAEARPMRSAQPSGW